jgi:hypothetical protein
MVQLSNGKKFNYPIKKKLYYEKGSAKELMSLTIHPPGLDEGAHKVVTQIVQCESKGESYDLDLVFLVGSCSWLKVLVMCGTRTNHSGSRTLAKLTSYEKCTWPIKRCRYPMQWCS